MPDPGEPTIRSLSAIDAGKCFALLAGESLGQVVYSDRALPEVTPVSFRLDGDAVAIRIGEGSPLARAAHGAVLAFHVDRYDQAARTGWSVTVVGLASAVSGGADLARMQRLAFKPSLAAGPDLYVRIGAERVTGRLLS